MKYIPILFSTPMVTAILEGEKTMTRRILKPQPYPVTRTGREIEKYFEWDASKKATDLPIQEWLALCPYGKVGDVLWVRETFVNLNIDFPDVEPSFVYKADLISGYEFGVVNWKPSLFMPKSASRIFLEITDVKVERLQDISEEDAVKEGIEKLEGNNNWKGYFKEDYAYLKNPKLSFISLWKSINGKDSWDENPFVWLIIFKRIEKPDNFC